MASTENCAGCGVAVPGGTAGCQALFDEMLARDFTSPAHFRVHRLMVDVYCLQHPERYCASAKSLAAHLTGLCRLLESGASRAVGDESLRRWLNGNPGLEKPRVPAARGRLTIADVKDVPDPSAYAAAVDRWAWSVWDAYAPLHALARLWIEQAHARGRPLAHR